MNVVKYIHWSECAKREQELAGVKADDPWKPDANGYLRVAKSVGPLKASLQSDLLLSYALKRRGLAL
eukprot:10816543-Alexandrium_andersonii.AAC.1